MLDCQTQLGWPPWSSHGSTSQATYDAQASDTFYSDRGVSLQSLEITKFAPRLPRKGGSKRCWSLAMGKPRVKNGVPQWIQHLKPQGDLMSCKCSNVGSFLVRKQLVLGYHSLEKHPEIKLMEHGIWNGWNVVKARESQLASHLLFCSWWPLILWWYLFSGCCWLRAWSCGGSKSASWRFG